jgi:hypothetical protein
MSAVPAPASVGLIARAFATVRGSFASGTGMAVLDASSDFQRARRAYFAARFARRGPSRPFALEGVAALPWSGARLRVIPLSAVIGTVDATRDFDARFRPAASHVAARWQRVALAHRLGVALPPISVVQRPEGYYVLDGRHRVSVARALRHRDIEAWVTPVVTVDPPAPRPTNGCDEERGSRARRATISPQSKGKLT